MDKTIQNDPKTKVIIIEKDSLEVTVLEVLFEKDRIIKLLGENIPPVMKGTGLPDVYPTQEYDRHVFVRKGDGYKKVSVADITYLEAGRNYCNIHLIDRSCLNVTMPMNEVYEYFSPLIFKRVHRSYVVNLAHVDTYIGNMLILKCGKTVTIGREYKEEVKRLFVCIGSRKRVREKKEE